MATQNDLVQAVLEELAVIGAAETADPDDSAFVKRRYENVRADLARKFLVDWESGADIPDEALEAMTLLVAHRCARSFGLLPDPQMKMDGMAMLWDYRNTPWMPTPPMKAEYY